MSITLNFYVMIIRTFPDATWAGLWNSRSYKFSVLNEIFPVHRGFKTTFLCN